MRSFFSSDKSYKNDTTYLGPTLEEFDFGVEDRELKRCCKVMFCWDLFG